MEAPRAGQGLGKAGARLWTELTGAQDPPPLYRPLLVEACRIVDRLETLDRQLAGHHWLHFRTHDDVTEVTVYVDHVLVEARGQALALKAIVAELEKVLPKSKPAKKGGGVLADLAAKRAESAARGGPPAH